MTNERTPKQMREDAAMWLRAGHPEMCAGRYKDAADQIERLQIVINAATSFAKGIHELVKRGKDTHDHGLLMNLSCTLDHLLPEPPDAFAPEPQSELGNETHR